MKSKIINFEDGLLGLKHRRGDKKIKNEDKKEPEEVEVSNKENRTTAKTIIYPVNNVNRKRVREILIEVFDMHQRMLNQFGGDINNFTESLFSGKLEDIKTDDAVHMAHLISELCELTGYTMTDLLLHGKFESLIYDYNVLDTMISKHMSNETSYKYDAKKRVDQDDDHEDDFEDEDEDEEDEDDEKEGLNDLGYKFHPSSGVNARRRRIKEIIGEIYDNYLEDDLLYEVSENPNIYKNLSSRKKDFVDDYNNLINELEFLTEHSATDLFLTENLLRLAKRYKVKLK